MGSKAGWLYTKTSIDFSAGVQDVYAPEKKSILTFADASVNIEIFLVYITSGTPAESQVLYNDNNSRKQYET